MRRVILLSVILGITSILLLAGCDNETNSSQANDENVEWIPEQPIEIVLPYSAGGGSDSRARILAQSMEKYLPGNQPINIINKPGGGGVPALTEVYNAKSDGLTLIYSDTTPMIVNEITSNVGYESTEFEAIGTVNEYNYALYIHPEKHSDITNWEELMEYSWEELNLGTVGVGTGPHMAGYFVGLVTEEYDPKKTNFVHYESTADAMAGFQRGDIDLIFGAHESNVQHAEEGSIRNLVLFNEKRSDISPDLPTSIELDIPNASGANEITQTIGALYAPPETPKEIKKVLSKAMEEAIEDADLIEKAESSSQFFTWHSMEDTQKRTEEIFNSLTEHAEGLQELIN